MPDEWIVRVHDKEYGPVDLETLQEWQRDGHLIPDNEVRGSDGTAWVKAATIPELFPPADPEGDSSRELYRSRTFGEIITETFRIYRQGFVSFFGLALLVAIPACALKICFAYIHLPEHGSLSRPAFLASAVAIVAAAIFLAVWPIFLAGIQIATADLASGRGIGLRDVLRRAINFWPRVAKLSLIVYGSYFVWSAIPLLAIILLVAAQPSALSLLLGLVILALQVYMTARLFVNFLFWQQSSVIAGHDSLESLRKSKDLARSRPTAPRLARPIYRGAILVSIWFLVLLVMSMAAELPFLFVRLQGITNIDDAMALAQNLANAPAPDAITIVTYVATSLIQAALRPLLGIAFVILYFNARADFTRKDEPSS